MLLGFEEPFAAFVLCDEPVAEALLALAKLASSTSTSFNVCTSFFLQFASIESVYSKLGFWIAEMVLLQAAFTSYIRRPICLLVTPQSQPDCGL